MNDPQLINLYSYGRNNPLKYVDPNGEDTVITTTDEYTFMVEKSGEDKKHRPWKYQVVVHVEEKSVVILDDHGKIKQRTLSATATAEDGPEALNRLTPEQLQTVGVVTGAIIEGADIVMNASKEEALAIGVRETFLGAEGPSTNPMKVTKSAGVQPSPDDMRANISLALDVYYKASKGFTLPAAEGLQNYGPGAGNPGGAHYGTEVEAIANGIRNGIQGSIRATGYHTERREHLPTIERMLHNNVRPKP